MKKVINFDPENTNTFNEVLSENNPIIGFKLPHDKVTLVPWKYNSNLYFARCVDTWEKGNEFIPNGINVHTIVEWEELFRTKWKSEMFVFDSPKELFKWLAE